MARAPSKYARYRAPGESTVVDLPSSRVGVTNGLLLKFPTVHVVGDQALLDVPGVAIVGSRKPSAAGIQRAEQLARDLVRAGFVVISGLAAGIDRAAHESALRHGGRTIAVIGTPLDKVYPAENAELQEEIYKHHLLISAFKWGDRFYPSNFPERNRIMARLARATVIVEAGDTSGSLHQAAESVSVRRPVYIAQSVANNPALKWPARFIGKPHAFVLESSEQLIGDLRR